MNLHQIHNSNIPNFRSISLSFILSWFLCHKFRCHFQTAVCPSRSFALTLDTSRSGIWVSLSHVSWDSLTNWRPTVGGLTDTGFFWATQRCMENVLTIMVDRSVFFSLCFFLVLAIRLPFLPRCYVYDLYVFIFDFSFAMSALSFFHRCKYEYCVSNFWTQNPKKSLKIFDLRVFQTFLKTWSWIFRASPDPTVWDRGKGSSESWTTNGSRDSVGI